MAMGFIRQKTQAIKSIKDLAIDSKQKTFSLKLELPGEPEELTVTGSYQVTSVNGKTSVTPVDIQTSKEWLTILAGELVKGRTFEVPAMAGSFL
jgi:hypothetical protein